MQLKKTNITVVLPSAEAQREMKEHIQAPERFSCHWLIKSPALLCGLRRGVSGNDRGTETKHPVRFSIKVLGPFQTTWWDWRAGAGSERRLPGSSELHLFPFDGEKRENGREGLWGSVKRFPSLPDPGTNGPLLPSRVLMKLIEAIITAVAFPFRLWVEKLQVGSATGPRGWNPTQLWPCCATRFTVSHGRLWCFWSG